MSGPSVFELSKCSALFVVETASYCNDYLMKLLRADVGVLRQTLI